MSITADISSKKLLVIQASKGFQPLELWELWEARELVLFMAWRDLTSRYRQAALGIVWTIIQPAMYVTMMSLFVGRVGHMSSDDVPYPVFVCAGVVPWQFASAAALTALQNAGSIGYLITKVFIPRLVIPVAAVVPPIVDSLLTLLVFAVLLVIWRIPVSPHIAWLPFFAFLLLLVALSFSLWIIGLAITFRDVRHIIPFGIQLMMFASPVFYSSSKVPQEWLFLYYLNPLATIIQGFRWSMFNVGRAPDGYTLLSTVVVIILLVTGVLFYERVSRYFADVI